MRPKLTRSPWLLAAICIIPLAFCQPAKALTLGVGDGAQFPATDSQTLGATTYRVVIDPALPLESYTPRILAHRAVGQEPQLVIGGTGTINHASSRGVVRAAVAAARRWPSAYSIGVINEPDVAGMGVCEYARTWVQAYRALTAAGVKRVPLGEWSPWKPLDFYAATLTRCPNSSPQIRKLATRVAWHGYWKAINYGPGFRAIARQHHARTPRLLITEAGAVLKAQTISVTGVKADTAGVRYWRHAMEVAKAQLDQIVVWDLHSIGESSAWDSSLIDGSGRRRPGFAVIAAAAR